MKILFIVHRFHPNLFYPVKSLIQEGHEVQLIVPKNDKHNGLVEDHTLTEPIKVADNQLSICLISKQLKQIKPNLIIQRHFQGKWKLFSILGRLRGIKCVAYDQNPQKASSFSKQLLHFLKRLSKCEPVHKFTPVLNRGETGKYKEPFSTYIPFPIYPLITTKQKTYRPDGTIRFLCVGKLGQTRKHHLLLLNALERININCSLTYVGAGPEAFVNTDKEYFKALQERCKNSSLRGGVKILMDLPYKDMLQLYDNHDILVMPAEMESLGQCILEGLASGCPVISSNDCGASSYVRNNVNGFVFQKNNVDDLADKIKFFTENPQNIKKFGENAIHMILDNHSPAKFAKAISVIARDKKQYHF